MTIAYYHEPVCAWCGAPLPSQAARRTGSLRAPKYCSRPCMVKGQHWTHPWGRWQGKLGDRRVKEVPHA